MTLKENIKDISTAEGKEHIRAGNRVITEAELLEQAKNDIMQQIMESITRLQACNVKL